MKNKEQVNESLPVEDITALTMDDLNEFMALTSYEEQWKTLLAHAEKNRKIIRIRRIRKMEQNNSHHYEEISKQFTEFLHTKGIVAKFKVAFADMAESAARQREADKANLERVKKQSREANPEFSEFLHTKGLKAKVKLVIEHLKKGAREASQKTAEAVDRIQAQTKANIAKAQGGIHITAPCSGQCEETKSQDELEYPLDELSREFNEFLKAKGLDAKYAAEIIDANDD